MAFRWIVLWQRFNQVIEGEPETPTVMKESERKQQRQHKQPDQNRLIAAAYHQQPDEAHHQNYKFSSNDIGQNRAYEKTLFAFEERAARRTMMSDMKGSFDERRLATSGAP